MLNGHDPVRKWLLKSQAANCECKPVLFIPNPSTNLWKCMVYVLTITFYSQLQVGQQDKLNEANRPDIPSVDTCMTATTELEALFGLEWPSSRGFRDATKAKEMGNNTSGDHHETCTKLCLNWGTGLKYATTIGVSHAMIIDYLTVNVMNPYLNVSDQARR